MICLFVAASLALWSSAVPAQPLPGKVGDTERPPPLPGPPPLSEPSTQPAPPGTPAPEAKEPPPKGYTGAYQPAGTPPKPYSTGPLPTVGAGPGLDKVGADGSTKSVKAVPCTTFAKETDGSTTCIGIPDPSP